MLAKTERFCYAIALSPLRFILAERCLSERHNAPLHRSRLAPVLEKCTPAMMVENVAETVAFYRDLLGFKLVMAVPENTPFAWALMQRDEVEVMFQERASLAADLPVSKGLPLGGVLTFYIDMQGVERFFDAIRKRVQIVRHLHTTFYGTREFAIRDCIRCPRPRRAARRA